MIAGRPLLYHLDPSDAIDPPPDRRKDHFDLCLPPSYNGPFLLQDKMEVDKIRNGGRSSNENIADRGSVHHHTSGFRADSRASNRPGRFALRLAG